ncbi:MAG: hypothetical protein IJ680_08810 [Paludibacteraceae bacterium]|nr:hypothetical protein [Paludibacteraceae bacterium]
MLLTIIVSLQTAAVRQEAYGRHSLPAAGEGRKKESASPILPAKSISKPAALTGAAGANKAEGSPRTDAMGAAHREALRRISAFSLTHGEHCLQHEARRLHEARSMLRHNI